MTAEADRRQLLRIARAAVQARVSGQPAPAGDPPTQALARLAAVFATLHRGGKLRGCIGHVEADRPLLRVVAECAAAAATEDPRFPPVTVDELPSLFIELSILGSFERVASLEQIEIGRHGLLVELHRQRGLLLPQVATEWQWDRATFVEQTYHKAGLARDAWPAGGATLWRFEAEVFGER